MTLTVRCEKHRLLVVADDGKVEAVPNSGVLGLPWLRCALYGDVFMADAYVEDREPGWRRVKQRTVGNYDPLAKWASPEVWVTCPVRGHGKHHVSAALLTAAKKHRRTSVEFSAVAHPDR